MNRMPLFPFQPHICALHGSAANGFLSLAAFFALGCTVALAEQAQVPRGTQSEIIERGQDFAVYRSVSMITNQNGEIRLSTNQFTLLENGLHYLEDGIWKSSEDVLEPFDRGVIARRGPIKAMISSDLAGKVVFDLEGPDGTRLMGAVRKLLITDSASGKSVVLATPKPSATAELLAPNQLLFRDAFQGNVADLVYIWKHNAFSQDIVLRARPRLPPGWDTANVRLEVVTEVFPTNEPELVAQCSQPENQPASDDHAVIRFGAMSMVVGKAFAVGSEHSLRLGNPDPQFDGFPIRKEWIVSPDGRHFVVESLGWTEVQASLEATARDQQALNEAPVRRESLIAQVPLQAARASPPSPVRRAQTPYEPEGLALDFIIYPDVQVSHFTSMTTYYIKSSYSSGAAVQFDPGCVIKFKNGTYMQLFGPMTFPATAPSAVFTSRDDNEHGQPIIGVPGETDSDGIPTDHMGRPLWIYFASSSATVRNVRIRWATTGIQYDGACVSHNLQDAVIEQSQVGLQNNLQPGGIVLLTNVKQCAVASPIAGSGSTSGAITTDCGVVSVARVNDPAQDSASGDPNKNSQSECSFVVVDSSKIVAAFFDTHLSEYQLGFFPFPGITAPRSTGWAVSVNGGTSFTDNGAIPPTAPANTSQGDAGDPVMARDTGNGAIYLLTNPSRESGSWGGFRLWKSTDNGQSFTLINSSVPSGATGGDKPMIAVNNFQNSPNYHYVYVVGSAAFGGSYGTMATYSTDGGVTWTGTQVAGPGGVGADLAVAPDGTVYIFYLLGGPPFNLQYSWRCPADTSWHAPVTISAHGDSQSLYATKPDGSGNLKRSNSAEAEDFFRDNAFPRVAVNPLNGRVYFVYADLPFAGSTTDYGDIFINEGTPNADGSLTIAGSGVRKVNYDATATDQWNPSIAINPAGTMLFVGYYSRQGDPVNNALIKAYGAKAKITDGFATATFEAFPINAAAFSPLFPGTVTSTPPANTWMYDHVWTQTDVCLDVNAMVAQCPAFRQTVDVYQHFMADDYTWASADGTYFYYAWCDRTDTYLSGANSRPDPNIRLAKVKQ